MFIVAHYAVYNAPFRLVLSDLARQCVCLSGVSASQNKNITDYFVYLFVYLFISTVLNDSCAA